MIRYLFFDFDGTVYDTVEGITRCVAYAMGKMGGEAPEPSALRCFAGPPLTEQFMLYCGYTREEAEQAVVWFRERYLPIGLYESGPFPGIGELLSALRRGGYRMAVATSKPTELARELLERAGISEYFACVCGSDPTKPDSSKATVLSEAMAAMGAAREKSLMIGDTRYDVEGAHQVGIPCVGVGWGYAAEGELEKAGADRLAATMEELKSELL